MNLVGDAYTKLSCKVAISGLSANLLTSFNGARADLQLEHKLLDTTSWQGELIIIRHYQPVHIPLPCSQFFRKHNTIPLLCQISTVPSKY